MVLEKKEIPPVAPRPSPPATSYGALFGAAEQPLRTKQDDRDQQEKRDRRAVLRGKIRGDEVVDDAEDQPAGDRAAHLVEAADDRGDEGDQAERLAVRELGEVDRADEERRERHQRGV